MITINYFRKSKTWKNLSLRKFNSDLLFESTKVFRNIADKFRHLVEKNDIRKAILNENKDELANRKDNPIDQDSIRNKKAMNNFFSIA